MGPPHNLPWDDLISRTKWGLSELAKRDVGTPYTVEHLLGILRNTGTIPEGITREKLIRDYLCSEKMDDAMAPGKIRLHGELMRFGAWVGG